MPDEFEQGVMQNADSSAGEEAPMPYVNTGSLDSGEDAGGGRDAPKGTVEDDGVPNGTVSSKANVGGGEEAPGAEERRENPREDMAMAKELGHAMEVPEYSSKMKELKTKEEEIEPQRNTDSGAFLDNSGDIVLDADITDEGRERVAKPDTFAEAIESETMRDASEKQAFLKAMPQSDVSVYTGHGPYGTGPDFDHKDKGDGNTWINPEKMEEVEAETSDITRSTHKGIDHVVIGDGEDQYTIELDDSDDWDEPAGRLDEADSDDQEDEED